MCDRFNDISKLLKHFNIIGTAASELFGFWLEYCNMVYLLLDFIAAERECDWTMHIESFPVMLPYDCAFDHYKYLSWGIIYIIDMLDLPEKHPDLYEHFMSGKHAVSRSKKESSFNCVSLIWRWNKA